MRLVLINMSKRELVAINRQIYSLRRLEYYASRWLKGEEYYISAMGTVLDLGAFTEVQLMDIYKNYTKKRIKRVSRKYTTTEFLKLLESIEPKKIRLPKNFEIPKIEKVYKRPKTHKNDRLGSKFTLNNRGKGVCHNIWEICFRLQETMPNYDDPEFWQIVKKTCESLKFNINTSSTQFNRWRRHLKRL